LDKKVYSKGCDSLVDITVGICVKNCERTIEAAIVSLLDQTFDKKRMEITVVDDGSRDATLSIIKKLLLKANVEMKLYFTNGGGLSVARQMVVENSCGNFLLFVDGDMVLPRDFVQEQFNVIKDDRLIGCVAANEKGRLNRGIIAELEDAGQSSKYGIGIHRNWARHPQALGTGGSIFRVTAIKEAGGFDSRIKGSAEDLDISARILSAGYMLIKSQAEFEHEFKQTLKGVWNKYAWYGHGMHFFCHQNRNFTWPVLIHFWPLTFIMGIVRSISYFKTTHRKSAFQLPFFQFFKATAWWSGFLKAHREGYGHEYRYSKQIR
jgi:glycosyltransferase involved in cell wall biosynthesis